GASAVSDLAALDAITEAVESGAGLPEVVRAAARALGASLAVTDVAGATLAVAARSPAEERALLSQGRGVNSLPLRVADTVVGARRMVARADPLLPADEGWRGRVRSIAERGARGVVSRSIAALAEREGALGAEVLLLIPGGQEQLAARAADAVRRELEAGLAGCTFAIGRSRIAEDPAELPRAASEALLAANVTQGSEDGAVLAFEQ